jgi:hypothetical protein
MGPENELKGYSSWHFTLSVLAIFSKIKEQKKSQNSLLFLVVKNIFLFFCDN